MLHRWFILTLLLTVLALGGVASAEELKTLVAGEVTITYPAEYEKAAQELAHLATTDFPPIQARMAKLNTALANTEDIVKRIADLLGCPECTDNIRERYTAMAPPLSDTNSAMQHHWRIFRKAELNAATQLAYPPVYLSKDPMTRQMIFSLNLSNNDEKDIGTKAFIPFCVNDDGSFPDDQLSISSLTTSCWIVMVMQYMALHEAVESTIINKYNLYSPVCRWFNDGIANYVKWSIVSEVAPDELSALRPCLFPSNDDPQRGKLNLLTWTQVDFSPKTLSQEEKATSDACYLYATEFMSRLLDDQPKDALGKIIQRVKDKPMAQTAVLCDAMKQVTGKDAQAILLEYVPAYVRLGIQSQRYTRYYADAKTAADKGNYLGTIRLLQQALEMMPEDMNCRFNLAWAMRKAGMPKEESERQITILRWLLTPASTLSPFDTNDNESFYVYGRTLQFANDLESARAAFTHVLAIDPQHADTLAALKEMDAAAGNAKE